MKNLRIKTHKNETFGGKVIDASIGDQPITFYTNNFFIKIITGAMIGFVNGFWGGGGGMICVPLLMHIIKLPEKTAHATTLLIMLPLSISSLIVYLISGSIDWIMSLNVCVGFIIGGIIGALILKKISNVWLGIIFSVIIIAGGVKLLI